MHFLGLDFIFFSLVLLLGIAIFIYAFRKYIARLLYKKRSFDILSKTLHDYLKKTYPKIKFDYSVIKQSESELNPEARKSIIFDDIIKQYKDIAMNRTHYPTGTPLYLQWSSYVFNCEPNRNKLPPDWGQRKKALLQRDQNSCFRCSKKITLGTVTIHMIHSLKAGGKYNLENLVPICRDCDKIINSDNKKTINLTIRDELYQIK